MRAPWWFWTLLVAVCTPAWGARAALPCELSTPLNLAAAETILAGGLKDGQALLQTARQQGFAGVQLHGKWLDNEADARAWLNELRQRSDAPLLGPEGSDWQVGLAPALCNVPNVTFLEAAHPTERADEFRVYFGGADTVIGTALIQVDVSSSSEVK